MIEGKSVLAVIPARGGSKGLPKKNLLPLGGKPLIAWSVEAAWNSRYIDRTILSSEDEEIIRVAQDIGLEVPFTRPRALSTDQASGTDVFAHAIEQVSGFDIAVLLQPTSPLRTARDIDACLESFVESGAMCAIAVTKPSKSPYWMYIVDEKGFMRPFIESEFNTKNRQEHPVVYVPNGAIYVADVPFFLQERKFVTGSTAAFEMPPERSVDIDTNLDFIVCNALIGEASKAQAGADDTGCKG